MTETASPTLREAVGQRVGALQRAHLDGRAPAARATLSTLRRAVSRDPGQDPLAWGLVLEGAEGDILPEHLLGRGDTPSRAEWAAYTALTCYAVHQQSQSRPMHMPGTSFGEAIGQLVPRTSESVKARFDALLTSAGFPAVRYHLRSLVTLLRSEGIAFDYGRFAEDLARLQDPRTRDRVLLAWGRDYVKGRHPRATAPDDGDAAESAGSAAPESVA